MLDNFWRDLRHTFRMFRRNPGFTAAVLVTLALGMAADTAVFSVVSSVLLRPLPGIREPGRVASLYRVQNGQTFDDLGYPDYRDYRDRNQSFTGLAGQRQQRKSGRFPKRAPGISNVLQESIHCVHLC